MNPRKISLHYLCLLLYNFLNRRQPRKRRMGSWSQCTNERLWRLPMNRKVGRGVPTVPSGVVKRRVLTVRRGGVRTRQPYPPAGESCFARTRRQDAGAPRGALLRPGQEFDRDAFVNSKRQVERRGFQRQFQTGDIFAFPWLPAVA